MQISPLHIHNFTARNTGEHRKLYPTEVSHIGIHKTHMRATSQTFPSYLSLPRVTSHTHAPMVLQLSILFQITLLPPLYNNSQTTIFPTATSTSKFQGFFQVKSRTYLVFMHFLTI